MDPTDLSDDQILLLAKGVYERRAAARRKIPRKYRPPTPEQRAEKAAYMKEYYRRPEVQSRRRAQQTTPEARKKGRERSRRRYWAKHHPGQPVPPGRITKQRWAEDHENRLHLAEIDAGMADS